MWRTALAVRLNHLFAGLKPAAPVSNLLLSAHVSIAPAQVRPTSRRLLRRYPAVFPDVMHRGAPQMVPRRHGGRSGANAVMSKRGRSQLRNSCALLDARSCPFARRGTTRNQTCGASRRPSSKRAGSRFPTCVGLGFGRTATTTASCEMTKPRAPLSDTFSKTRSGRGWFPDSATTRLRDRYSLEELATACSQG